jgi:tRNA G26 N,N-dimethylase Trm1
VSKDLADIACEIDGEACWKYEMVRCLHCNNMWLIISPEKVVKASCDECGKTYMYLLNNDLWPGDWHDEELIDE